ncbi:MAG: hypothetical protein ACM3VZ_14060 [Acidobacteriota bacterium]
MKSFKRSLRAMGLIAALVMSPLAQAHDDAYLDTVTAPHGGQLRMAGGNHYELVVAKDPAAAQDKPVTVYVTDHAGTPIPVAGASGQVTLLDGKTKLNVTLKPDGPNKLSGRGAYASGPTLKAVVKIKLAGQDEQQARFTPLAPRAGAAPNSGHSH